MYEEIVDDILQLEKSKPVDYWRDRAEVPILTEQPFYNYSNNIIPDEEVITMRIDTRGAQASNPFNCLVCASTGVGKTRLIKNIVKAYHKQNYKILYIEPKSIEMLNARKMGQGRRLHLFDKNEKLPVVGYCPNYIRMYLEMNFPRIVDKIKFYSPNIKTMDYVEIWQSFGVPVKIASHIVDMIRKGHTNIDYFQKKLDKRDLHHATRLALSTSLDSLKATSFFGTTKKLELEKEWEKNNIVDIPYFSRDGAIMNTDIGLVLDLVRDIGMNESRQGLENVSKKLIIFDDAFMYAGISATLATKTTGGINLAIRNISNCQNNFRSWGINSMFVVQSPDSNAIMPLLIDGCTTKLVSYTENPQTLRGKIPLSAFYLITNTDPSKPQLYIDEESYTFQWIYVQGKSRWKTGFPFDCSVGHT